MNWGNPTTKPVDATDKLVDKTDDEVKQEQVEEAENAGLASIIGGPIDDNTEWKKSQRQQLKLQCLQLAHNQSDVQTPDDVVTRAKAYYAFVRT